MKELQSKNAQSCNSYQDSQKDNNESMQNQNSIANNDPSDVEIKQKKNRLTDNNPVILLESEDGEDHEPGSSSPSKISQELRASREEKLKKIIQMKNEFKKSYITNPRNSNDGSNRGSITSRNSKEKASGQSIRMSIEKLLLGESVTSNTSFSKQDPHKKLSASKTERLLSNAGNSADKVNVLTESPRIMMNPRTS